MYLFSEDEERYTLESGQDHSATWCSMRFYRLVKYLQYPPSLDSFSPFFLHESSIARLSCAAKSQAVHIKRRSGHFKGVSKQGCWCCYSASVLNGLRYSKSGGLIKDSSSPLSYSIASDRRTIARSSSEQLQTPNTVP